MYARDLAWKKIPPLIPYMIPFSVIFIKKGKEKKKGSGELFKAALLAQLLLEIFQLDAELRSLGPVTPYR
jgi:hypothetical protein